MGSEGGDAERTMSEAESLMWRLEADPTFASSFATIAVVDRPVDFDRLRRRLQRAVVLLPRLRQKVMARAFGLPPLWVDVAAVDLDVHIRRQTLSPPGTLRQLLDVATALLAEPLDRDGPLWELHVFDGLEGGRGAVLPRLHHSLSDGQEGMRMALHLLDLTRDAPEPPELTDAERAAAAPRTPPTPVDLLRDLVEEAWRAGTGVVHEVGALVGDPARRATAGAALGDRVRGTVATLADLAPARSPLWQARSLDHHLDVVEVELGPVRSAAHRLGGTVNVAFLTAAAAAAGAYHRDLGRPVEALRASMAVSTRGGASGANAFTLVRLDVPTGEMPPDERFRRVAEAATAAAQPGAAGTDLAGVATLAALVPTPLLLRAARQQVGTVDVATSNVRATPFPVYVAGARILAAYPIGPLAGVPVNLTLLGYDGHLDIGVHVDPSAITEPERLRRGLVDAFADLVGAATGPRRSPASDPDDSTKQVKRKKKKKKKDTKEQQGHQQLEGERRGKG